jgi:putative flippase GtrA
MTAIRSLIAKMRDDKSARLELIRFLIVGGIGTIVSFVVFNSVLHLADGDARPGIWWVTIASLLGNEVAMVTNFFCHEHWTFGTGERHGTAWHRLIRYQFVALTGIIANAAIVTGLVHIGVQHNLAFCIAILIVLSWNYFMSRKWAWRHANIEPLEHLATPISVTANGQEP